MAARGTRRPHPRRVYKHPRKPSRTTSGGGGGCLVLALALAVVTPALGALGWTVFR
jgi:hypothetical protein